MNETTHAPPEDVLRLAVLGCGAMAGAMVEALARERDGRLPCDVVIRNRTHGSAERFAGRVSGVRVARSAEELLTSADVLVIGVKPDDASEALEVLRAALRSRPEARERTVFLSIMAGVTRAEIESELGGRARVVVSMPTMLVQHGPAPLLVAGDERDLATIETALSSTGSLARIGEEEMRFFTVFFGCLPGYLDKTIEALLSAANATSVGRRVAVPLLGQALGAYAQLMQRPGYVPGALAQSVESPRGVTARMNMALTEGGLPVTFRRMYEEGLDWPGWRTRG